MRRKVLAVAAAVVLPLLTAALVPFTTAARSAPTRSSKVAAMSVRPTAAPPTLPPVLSGGAWPTSHVQGVAVDRRAGAVYWSFTQMLVKTDLSGRLLGTVTGLTGHLGDLDLDPDDGRVYGTLEYRARKAFHVAIFDGSRIDRVGMDAETSGVLTTVNLQEVADDFGAGVGANRHRYGCSGIDGISFGPRLGDPHGGTVLMVAYGIYSNVERDDNDHQVLLEYDVRGWGRYERPLSQREPHRSGPPRADRKIFVPTGNTSYGVQNLEYDPYTGDWLMAVYRGVKPGYRNRSLYLIDGAVQPHRGAVPGQPTGETGWIAPLVPAGLHDPRTGVWGWDSPGSRGLESLGDGTFYLVSSDRIVVDGVRMQQATATLHRWTGATPTPFAPTP